MTVPLDAAELAAKFRAVFGAAPDGVWQAPGRVNLIGEHTDYNEGFVLPFAIDKTAQVAVRVRADSTVRMLSTFGHQGLTTAAGRPRCTGTGRRRAGPSIRSVSSGRCRNADIAVPGFDLLAGLRRAPGRGAVLLARH